MIESEYKIMSLEVSFSSGFVNPDPETVELKAGAVMFKEYIDQTSEQIFTKVCNHLVWFLIFSEALSIHDDEKRASFMNRRKKEIISSLNLDTNDYKYKDNE